jgi:16S rRNA (cytidine1402-2'-O)-methyltransferase
MDDTGCLYLVATPIGNLGDFTDRGKKVLSECDLIACEDTRVTKKLLSHLELSKPMISYREENERKQSEFSLTKFQGGNELHYYPMQDTRGLAILGFAW